MRPVFGFDESNGYISKSPFTAILPLKKAKSDQTPLTCEGYYRLSGKCPYRQIHNLWKLVINTVVWHGEIYVLAGKYLYKKWIITIKCNLAIKDHFTSSETESGIRMINLRQAVINVLIIQMAFTRIGK